ASAGEALGRRAVVCFASGQQDGEFAAFDLWRPTASEGAGNFVASMAKRQDISVAEVEKQFFEKIRPTSLLKRFESTEEVASAVAFVASTQAVAINGAAVRAEGGVIRSIF